MNDSERRKIKLKKCCLYTTCCCLGVTYMYAGLYANPTALMPIAGAMGATGGALQALADQERKLNGEPPSPMTPTLQPAKPITPLAIREERKAPLPST